ncbi:MAG TPA: YggS family pyridoxal phosphate-dependent enzyme [Gemmatimonadaceae bacterium]|nr:YggS family pyridoxal phosphate-dependent enzyme [Gemmatimonadaceae bacterium]
MSFSDLPARLAEVRGRIADAAARGGHGQRVTIVAVTKTHGPEAVEAAWSAGVGAVGENRVQEALAKMERVSVPARWHLIGHLQRNKAKAAARFALVHSLDSARLADALHEVGMREERALEVLVQVNVSAEESKGGYSLDELPAEAERLTALHGIRVAGVMTMAPLDADEWVLRRVFSGAREAREMLTSAGHPAYELSMGMSGDYEIAVEEGATMVRLGTVLFGARSA